MNTRNLVPNMAVAHMKRSGVAIIFVAIAMFLTAAFAGEGHDHGDAAPAATGTGSPRVSSHSDLFELVGIVDADVMTIYLDRYATNEPLTGAQVEVEAGAAKGVATPQADGSYRFEHPVFKEAAALPVSFTVLAGLETDLLAGDLTLKESHGGHDDEHAARPWRRWAAYAAAGLALLAVAATLMRRKYNQRSQIAIYFIASCALLTGATASFDAQAGEGHDHGEVAPAATAGNSPKRQADGNVFLPKPTQRQLELRTVMVEEKSLPKTVELTGRVANDPNAGGKVQPTQAGRIEAGPRGLPQLGQSVRKGDTLAVVRASTAAIERANQVAQTAELKANLNQARKRLARLEQLEGTVAMKDIDAARADVESLAQRLAAVSGSVRAVEVLTAPVSGVIAAAHAMAGQVVNAGDVLFEIVDPARLVVQASAFDTALVGNIASATVSPSAGTTVALRFVGAGRTLQEGAIPLQFNTVANNGANPLAIPLAVGQPVKVYVQTKDTVLGFAVPTGAVVKNPSNQDIVWVHTAPEVFEARPIRMVALDGARVSVVHGLKAGDRVVTQGAPLVNQVR
jgi:cobalt-zinc-cadmium efflux system membrane fusion protein